MLTPIEIDEKKFSHQLKGYNVNEVDDFLDEIADDYENILFKVNELEEKNQKLEKDLEESKKLQNTLQETLVIAKQTADEIKRQAESKALEIIESAKTSAEEESENLDNLIIAKQNQLEEIKKQIEEYRSNAEEILVQQLELLRDLDETNN